MFVPSFVHRTVAPTLRRSAFVASALLLVVLPATVPPASAQDVSAQDAAAQDVPPGDASSEDSSDSSTEPVTTVRRTLEVTAASPELSTELALPASQLEGTGAADLAAALREEPGLAAVRRGSINLEPSVRGLQETQVAMSVDGTRTFAAGPARMDSDLSHVSLHSVDTVRVVKGPYALTWGAGAMSAVDLVTNQPSFTDGELLWGGRTGIGYVENGNRNDLWAGVSGATDRWRFSLTASGRQGDDYEAGDGTEIPGDYRSSGVRARLGWRSDGGTRIGYSGGYQEQNDLDYPGRLLDATYFYTRSHAVEVSHERPGGTVAELYGQLYVNRKDHRMNNDEKPTGRAVPGRMPPFALDIDLPTESNTTGGRAFAHVVSGDWRAKLGGDWYRSEQTAVRRISRRDLGVLLFEDVVWPDAEISDAGVYVQVVRGLGEAEISAGVRVDSVEASAGEVSPFFLANTVGDPSQDEMNLSAAVSGRWRAGERWLLTVGMGRAVRTANALERYSDRFPSTKFQLSAEFMGNPSLDPEQSLEVDLGAEMAAGDWSLSVAGFWRRIDDYITVVADPSLPKRLPLSPPTVYRYVNGDRATYRGGEVLLRHAATDLLSWRASLAYTWAEDEALGEPVLGIPPLVGRVGVTLRPPGGRFWGDLGLTVADEQDRVATSRFEVPTEGYAVVDLRAGMTVRTGLELEAGVENAADESYADHLNARNPFTGGRIPEPGRSFLARLTWEW